MKILLVLNLKRNHPLKSQLRVQPKTIGRLMEMIRLQKVMHSMQNPQTGADLGGRLRKDLKRLLKDLTLLHKDLMLLHKDLTPLHKDLKFLHKQPRNQMTAVGEAMICHLQSRKMK